MEESDCEELVAVKASMAAEAAEALVAPVAARCCLPRQCPCHLPHDQCPCRNEPFLALVPVILVVQDLPVDSVASTAAAQVAALVAPVVQEETTVSSLRW